MIQIHVSNFIYVALVRLRVKEVIGSPDICPDCNYSLSFKVGRFHPFIGHEGP
jgi:hypothetical protein